jgi:hypothetical protein
VAIVARRYAGGMSVGIDIEYEYNRGEAQRLATSACSDLVTSMCNDTLTYATPATPVRTGRLRAANQMQVDAPSGWSVEGTVFNATEYAMDVHQGTRPHVIRPRNAQALRFEGAGGGIEFAMIVHHPGTAPRPFLAEGAAIAAPLNGFTFTTT